MKRSAIRELIIQRIVAGWQDSTFARDGSLTVVHCRFGMKQAIDNADNKAQWTELKAYYDSLTERGRNGVASQARKKLLGL